MTSAPPQCEALASPGLPLLPVWKQKAVGHPPTQWLTGKLRLRWRNLMAGQQ